MRLLSLALALLALALPAWAAEFELSPTRVQLDARHLVDTVQVGNSGASPLSFEVTVSRWRMGADGAWLLESSDDLVVHPLLLVIAPGSKARLRVGLLAPHAEPGEAAYRIELHEQPSAASASNGNGVRMLTKSACRCSWPVAMPARRPRSCRRPIGKAMRSPSPWATKARPSCRRRRCRCNC
jgi:P pilus assembly chaperone PapD